MRRRPRGSPVLRVLLFVNRYYPPDVASAGQHVSDVAEYLAAHGWQVTVLAGSGRYDGGQLDAPAREVRCGVAVQRVRTLGLGRASRIGRVVDAALFAWGVFWRVLWAMRRSAGTVRVIYLTTPPLVFVLGLLVRVYRGKQGRYGIWSMDLHPEAEIAAGMFRPRGVVASALRGVANAAYRRADLVVTLGRYMTQRVRDKGVPAERIRTVPVWADDGVASAPAVVALREQLGVAGRFVVMYSGNAGLVHELDVMLQAMRLLRDDPGIFFLFVGGGPRRGEIEVFARAHGIRNFAYRPYVSRADIATSLAVADAHLVSLRPEFVGIAVPGKLYAAMAAARPILFVGPEASESADAVRAAACGEIVVAPDAEGDGNAPARLAAVQFAAVRLASVVRRWRADPAAARAVGLRGRAAYLARYTREANCAAFARVVGEVWPEIPS